MAVVASKKLLDVRLEELGPLGKRILVDRHAVHDHALAHRHEVRGRVDPHPESLAREAGGDQRARRALAVRAGHVDAREVALGVAEQLEQLLGGAQAPFDAAGLARKKEPAGVVER
jgi:hypothetical protein